MSFRLTHLFSAMLIGTCVSTVAFAAASQTLVWRGDVTTARGVVNDIAKAWEKTGHGKIELQPFNTASGLDAVTSGKADIAGSARGNIGGGSESSLTFTPVAWDALVMVTHPSNPVSSLTLAQLHDIYYGKITNWKDVGGRDEPIDLYAVASPGDGVEYSLRRLLFGRGNQPVAAPRLYVNTAKLEEGVTLDSMGLGATTMAGIRGNAKVKILRIDGTAPSSSSVANGSYPLYTPLYLVTNATSPKAADAQAFVDFVSGDKGKSILHEHELVPYQDGIALASMDAGRRSKILAETGGHASSEPVAAPVAAAAAGATLATAGGAQRVTATKGVLAAIQAGNSKKAKQEAIAAASAKPSAKPAEQPSLADVNGSATTTTIEEAPSLDHVVGDVVTVASVGSRGSDFSRVTADAVVVHGKPTHAKAAPKAVAKEPAAKKVAEAKPHAAAKPAKAEKTAKAMKTYTVAHGDTLYSIAHKHAVDEAQVRSWNHLKDNKVKQGQTLIVGTR